MQMSFIKKVSQCELTKKQLKIADYIAKNPKRVIGMTAMEIAKELGVSDASVIRFSRAVGYQGFADLKEQIREECKLNSEKIGKHSLYDRFVMQTEKYPPEEDSRNEVLQLMGINLETSLRQNSEEAYDRTVSQILQAKRKVVIGYRGGKGCALQFARLLGHLSDQVECITDEGHDQICKLEDLGEKDIVFFLNFQRYYKIDEGIGTILGHKKIPCILLTDSMASPIVKYASEILLVETEHCGFFHSMIGVTAVLEYLLILMCQRNSDIFRERLRNRDQILSWYLA